MNNKSVAINILQINEQKTREKQVVLLMITGGECNSPQKQHYLAVKKCTIKKNNITVEIIV